ncbi:transcription factor bHLH110 isoform X1 [Senna tora]|uniref:Transcription factor bHLH110 isoform X1 n=1 Tax=Senna tora TaxID=362788 RepID=A0A834TWY2_9FABA|nr:transcription factor bHLH110 isoform X1 [Senna tora]
MGFTEEAALSPHHNSLCGNNDLKNEIMVEEGGGACRSRDSSRDSGEVRGRGYEWASDDAESCLSTSTHSTHHFSNQHIFYNTLAFPTRFAHTTSSTELDHQDDDFKLGVELNTQAQAQAQAQLSSAHLYSPTTAAFGAPKFTHIHPTINISNLNHSPNINMHSTLSSYMIMHDNTSSIHSPTNLGNGVVETKRPSAVMESKPSQSQTQTASKKIRPQSRSSCPPLKVRKEKLGDRIAALQQLVAPFGKTDTASVLMEAIGYIKFLQNQVETLSVPYMKSSRNRVMQAGSGKDRPGERAKRDLRSGGLCVVPLSCMSYITGDHAAPAVWNQ